MITAEKKKLGKIRHKLTRIVETAQPVEVKSMGSPSHPGYEHYGFIEQRRVGNSNESGYYFNGKKIPIRSIQTIDLSIPVIIVNPDYLKAKEAVA
jgi:hypothetical protein